jgi:hypothetical protein
MSNLRRSLFCVLFVATLLPALPRAEGATDLVVRAGAFARKDTPVSVVLPANQVGPKTWESLKGKPKAVQVRELRGGNRQPTGAPIVAELEPLMAGGSAGRVYGIVRLTFILSGETPVGGERRFRVEPDSMIGQESPWTLSERSAGALELLNRGRTVFRYNMAPVSNPDFPKVPARDAYIHPAYSPAGTLITGDYSPFHPHHRGFFLAYTKTSVGDSHPDFWNIHNGTGIIRFEHLESTSAGPVIAGITARHRWETMGTSAGAVLREFWHINAFDIPGSPYWLFDLTSIQRAVGAPLALPPYRYGGMAYRGPEPFVKGVLDVLTSEGFDRRSGDQKPARWVDLTGPIADGSPRYAGALILDHPSNPHHPTPARIHPTTLPFFAFTPSHDTALTILADKPTIFRYRVVIHDGHPDRTLDERLWRDFATPPEVEVKLAPD